MVKRAPAYDINPDPDPVLYLVAGIEKQEKRVGGDVIMFDDGVERGRKEDEDKEREREKEREYLSRWCRNGSAMAEPAWGTHTLFQCWQ